uniref:SecY-independent transporter protein n=1 Tax=Pterocladiella luxurians TaxID=2909240 RepID=A0A1D8X7L6_9FLOR|nr:SecY-independent transporter protein [Gelidium crinale f. luxurians]
MNYPIYFYSVETFWKIVYFLLNLISLVLVIWNKMDSIVFFEMLPFISTNKKFIVLGVTDLLDLFWFNCFSLSFFLSWPFLTFQLNSFFKSSWHYYQFGFVNSILFWWSLIVCSVTILFFHLKILPSILSFFTQWDVMFNQNQTSLVVESQLNILSYITWILEFHYFINYCILITFYYIISLFLKKNLINNYLFIKNYRKGLLFYLIILIFFIIPPELIQQLIVFFVLYLSSELTFLFSCVKLTNNLKTNRNANYSSIIKETTS